VKKAVALRHIASVRKSLDKASDSMSKVYLSILNKDDAEPEWYTDLDSEGTVIGEIERAKELLETIEDFVSGGCE